MLFVLGVNVTPRIYDRPLQSLFLMWQIIAMDSDGTKRDGKKGNVITLRTRQHPPRKRMGTTTEYPKSWRKLCRRIVLAYQEMLAVSPPKRAGAQTIRMHIMKDFDCDSRTTNEDRNLTKSDVFFWLRDDTHLSPVKFAYIDLFVKNLQISEKYEWVMKHVLDYKEREHKIVFSELYSFRKDTEEGQSSYLESINGMIFRSEKMTDTTLDRGYYIGTDIDSISIHEFDIVPFREIWLYIRNVDHGVASVTILYSRNRLSKMKPVPNSGHWSVAFGYLVPLSNSSPSPNLLSGVLKSFRPSLKGNLRGGHSSSLVMSENNGLSLGWDENIVSISWFLPEEFEARSFNNIPGKPDTMFLEFKDESKNMDNLSEFMSKLTSRYLIW